VSTVQTQVGRIVWHQLLSTDVEGAKGFYTELFGWGIEVWKPGELDAPMISANGTTHGGFQQAPEGAPSHWVGHVQLEDANAALARAEALGGRSPTGPVDMPEVGRFVVIQDPHGAVLSAYTPESEGGPVAEGVFLWDELLSPDVAASKRFYTEVFGWTTSEMNMGELGMGEGFVYTMFKRSEDDPMGTAGLMKKPGEMPGPAVWIPYLATDDVDASISKATELGAATLVPAMDVPTVGRVASLADPTGALFGLFKPVAQ
jgi:predicted enzyme related to lactoylglutathione lyase